MLLAAVAELTSPRPVKRPFAIAIRLDAAAAAAAAAKTTTTAADMVVPIIAVDFSLGNLTFDELKCLHSLKQGRINPYRDVLEATSQGRHELTVCDQIVFSNIELLHVDCGVLLVFHWLLGW